MSLFVKGTWRRYHVESEELTLCWETLWARPRTMFALSALAGRAVLVSGKDKIESTFGINPPSGPRLDCGLCVEQGDIDRYLLPHLAINLRDEANLEPWVVPEEAEMPTEVTMVASDGWGRSEHAYRLFHSSAGVVGFWVVSWSQQDLIDKPSLREERSAASFGMPYKLLSSEAKKELFGDEKEWEVTIARKQVPVIMDLISGDIWLGSGSTKFAKALACVLAVGGLIITPGELILGETKDWLRPALNAVRDKDLYKLEREEAITRKLAPSVDPVDDGEGTKPQDANKQADNDRQLLMELGAWCPDDGGEILVLKAEATVALNQTSASTVATVSGQDALELFISHPKAELSSCCGEVTIPPPPADSNGSLANIGVDFTEELTQGIYRNLEFAGVRNLWNELLEEPWIRGHGSATSVVDSELRDHIYGARYNRYWFRYYLQMKEFERCLIHGFARVLDFDPSLAGIRSRSLFAKTTAPKDTLAAAAQKLKEAKDHLLPGETVSFSVNGPEFELIRGTGQRLQDLGNALKPSTQTDDFLDDIPEVD